MTIPKGFRLRNGVDLLMYARYHATGKWPTEKRRAIFRKQLRKFYADDPAKKN